MRNLRSLLVQGAAVLAATLTFTLAGGAAEQGGLTYAIRGAKIITVSGAPIDNGTVVIRNGVIQAVGANVQIPVDAIVTDGAGMTVYPGFIDLASAAPLGGATGPVADDGGFGGGGGRGGGGGQAVPRDERSRRGMAGAGLGRAHPVMVCNRRRIDCRVFCSPQDHTRRLAVMHTG